MVLSLILRLANSIYLKEISEKGEKKTKATKWSIISSILSAELQSYKGWKNPIINQWFRYAEALDQNLCNQNPNFSPTSSWNNVIWCQKVVEYRSIKQTKLCILEGNWLELYGRGTTTNKQYKKGQKKTHTTGQKEDAYSVADHI